MRLLLILALGMFALAVGESSAVGGPTCEPNEPWGAPNVIDGHAITLVCHEG